MYKMSTLKKIGITVLSASAIFLAACESDDGVTDADTVVDGEEIELTYVDWDSEIASTYVVGAALEEIGYDVTFTSLDNAVMWQSVATGESDGMVSAMLPGIHAAQYEEYGDSMDHLGTNLDSAQIGLVVPEYMDVDSIEDLTDEAGQEITGIDAGAGAVQAAEDALEDYDNLSDWTVTTSSSGAMVTALGQAIANEEEVVVTGWVPHWKFQAYDLKFLEDTELTFGDDESMETFVREGLEEDMPEAYSVLSNFHWEQEDIETVMLDIQDGDDPEQAAEKWIEKNQDKVEEWIADVQ